MTYNITPEQQLSENLDLQASMWAYRVMTRKMTNDQCKIEIARQFGGEWVQDAEEAQIIPEIQDMQARVRRYLKAGLVTEETYAKKLDSQLYRLKQRAKAAPEPTQSTSGSKDGLWSKSLAGK
tara:strand:- start:2321 stop:2689 length:369 start_codon:yes stop_codon:yes gene_type:complete